MRFQRLLGTAVALVAFSAFAENAAVRAALQPYVDSGELPGILSMTWDNGRTETTAVGVADPETQRPFDEKSVFWIASMTKGFTAAAVMTLVDAGKLSLDDPLEKYIPGIANLKVDGKPPSVKMTLRMCLSHVAGFDFQTPTMKREGIWSRSMKDLADEVCSLPLPHEPLTGHRYSNIDIDLCARVVEVASGMSFDDYLDRTFFKPLGMTEATFRPTAEQLSRLVYAAAIDDGKPYQKGNYCFFDPAKLDVRKVFPEGGGGLFATAGDVMKFYAMLANDGVAPDGTRILSHSSIVELSTAQYPKFDCYTLGLRQYGDWFGHDGALQTEGLANWKEKKAGLLFVQVNGPWDHPFKDAWRTAIGAGARQAASRERRRAAAAAVGRATELDAPRTDSGLALEGVTADGKVVSAGVERRDFSDGVAMRYRLPEGGCRVQGENTVWTLPADAKLWYQPFLYGVNYEAEYVSSNVCDLAVGAKLAMPVTARLADGTYRLLTEANVVGYTDSALQYVGDGKFRVLHYAETDEGFETAERTSPWRVTLVASNLNDLATSDIVRRLCPEPSAEVVAKCASFVKPGRSIWQWLPAGDPVYGEQADWYARTQRMRYEYYLIDDGWKKWRDGDLDQWACLKKVIAMGRETYHVESFVWADSKEMPDAASRRAYLRKVKDAGAVGIKIDFIPQASKKVVDWYEATLADTLELGLMVDFHGAVKPSGREKTWPHEVAREAIRGHEYHITRYKRVLKPEHDCILPFTRLVQGHADYTPVVFEKKELNGYTWARELAQGVVFSAPFLCFGDYPKNYLDNPAVRVLKAMPATYDEVRYLPGSEIGACVAVAKRKGDSWFVAVENGAEARRLDIPLTFLGKGEFNAMEFADDPKKPDGYSTRERKVTARNVLGIDLAPCGGFLARIVQIPPEIVRYDAMPGDAPCARPAAEREAEVLRALFQGLGSMACGEIAHKSMVHGDHPVAVREIAAHFRRRRLAPGYDEKPAKCDFETANRAVTGDVTVVNLPWAFKDGKIDWFFNPTGKNGLAPNSEWHMQLNRMYFWKAMADAYALTSDETYAKAFREQLRSWIATTEPRGNGGYVTWRTLEAGIRLGIWPYVFERFRKSPSLTDEDLCLMLGSLVEHLKHVMAHRSAGSNWVLIQMNGIYTTASLFPEFGESAMYRREAAHILAVELAKQVLPDGYQHELTPDYHSCAWHGFSTAYRLGKLSGHLDELPPDYCKNLEKLADAMLNLATPCLTEPRCNDCFTIHIAGFMKDAVAFFPKRKDFLWGLTGRKEGTEPKGATASRILPWSGYAALRSDWGPDATYLFFDFGPLSAGHYHQDKLNIVMFKGGEELIFDDGGGQYESSDYRRYAVSGRGHNTLLVDGCAQQRKSPNVMKEPIDAGWETTPEYDFIRGVYDQGYQGGGKQVTQTREIRFDKKADVFTVTDAIAAKDGQAHDYELLFQLDTTNAVVSADGKRLRADYGPGRKWSLEMTFEGADVVTPVSARLKPTLAGWYVGRNDQALRPATTVFVKASAKKDHRFVTTLKAVPSR